MPRYFFHVREGAELTRDPEGQELPNAEAARTEAIRASREILSEKLLHGGNLGGRQVEIADDQRLAVIGFLHAVETHGAGFVATTGVARFFGKGSYCVQAGPSGNVGKRMPHSN